MREWSLQTTGWHLKGSDKTYDLSNLNPEEYGDALFYKDRWMNENDFRLMKAEFEARPVFLQRDDRIAAHFLTCFLSLLLYKYLEKKINRGINHFTPEEIITALTDMNFVSVQGDGYVPTYTRTDLTNAFHESAGFRTDRKIVTKKEMRKIISYTKNKRQQKNNIILLENNNQ